MTQLDLIAEVDRQFAVCNACRYCEGFCAVFPAAELRSTIAGADVAYLANLCHDCRMCYDACMFTPPHEFAVNVPAVLAQARVATYAEYAVPRVFGRLVTTPAAGTAVVALLGLLVALGGALASLGIRGLLSAHTGPGAFYQVVPFAVLTGVALTLSLLGIGAIALGVRRFARDINTTGPKPLRGGDWLRAAREALALTYLRGGGGGCYDVKRGSQARRAYHSLVFWGFIAALISTTAAAIEQDLLGIMPPFAWLSVPVLVGSVGGVAMVAGCAGLIALKLRSDPAPLAPRAMPLDYTFLALLGAVALSGLALLVLRASGAMPVLLTVHLALLLALYLTAPYGKFVHFAYRLAALIRHAAEMR